MAVETRPELVGKRFLCVGGGGEEPPESGRWRAGVIRAVSQRDSHSPDLAVYVEFDDLEWEKREWVKVYEDFATFLVEYQLVWAKRKDPSQTQGSKIKQIQWPALRSCLIRAEGEKWTVNEPGVLVAATCFIIIRVTRMTLTRYLFLGHCASL
ncbi:probable JmjC domain-containing histone demethylation protein 2C [Grus japonensis]|uniref:Probable JmjC domain-containing histone demethylation protein 2C n=1 Tax=Grus japonensis TaxID=30415 RepID=A0ABC9X414_GRUJA